MTSYCIEGLPVWLYGALIILGYLAGTLLYFSICRKTGTAPLDFLDLSLTVCISSLVGARLMYIFNFRDQFSSINDVLAIHEGGLVFYGAMLAAVPATGLLSMIKQKQVSEQLDLLSPSFSLAHAVGRLGCLFNSCCYGRITDFPTFYRLPSDTTGTFRHPTQLYEAFFLGLLTIILVRLQNQKNRLANWNFKGMAGGIYFASYSLFRFLVEFIRGDDRGNFLYLSNLSPAQAISLAVFALSLIWMIFCRQRHILFKEKINEQG